jgi:single-stranded-DNA-specific exonuclease
MRPWNEPPPIHVPPALAAAVGGHPLVAEALARRGITDAARANGFLYPDRYIPTSPQTLPGMGRAIARITRAIRAGEPVCVWGDFDVDGQTSTALLVSVLRDLGAEVSYHVPNREIEGHGVALEPLAAVIAEGARLIVTCDTGIAAVDAVAHARRLRVDFVITDHHDLPERLPEAAAIVNPKLLAANKPPRSAEQTDGPHALLHLPGVGIAYKLAEALYDWAGRGIEAEKHLDLAALGIIADVATLRGDTRWLAQRGLAALRDPGRLGLQALLESAEVDSVNLTEEHVAFALAPRLNAAGRLADASQCVELLTTGDMTTARIIAADLEALNAKRKGLTDLVAQQAQAQIAGDPSLLEHAALVLASPLWHPGIIGIVASRLVERYGRPTVLIALPEGGPGRGSARSVDGVDISAAISACASLLLGFGGHPMAAGLTVAPEAVPALRAALSEQVAAQLQGRSEPDAVDVDCVLPLPDLSLDLVADVARLGPFGAGNPALTLCAPRLEVKSNRLVGRHEEHRILTVGDESGFERQVVWWNGGSEAQPQGVFDLAYAARASSYRGERSVQVELLAWRTSPGEPEIVVAPPAVETLDFRGERAALPALAALLAEGDAVVFAEGEVAEDVPGRSRLKLEAARTLVFWTTPSSPAEVRGALEASRPERVALFAVDPGADRPDAFLRRLSGLVKHALSHRDGRATVAELAAATAQRETVALLGLRWLQSNGSIFVVERPGGELLIGRGVGRQAPQAERDLAAARLRAALDETAAFRAYFEGADKDALLRGYLV